VVFHSYAATPDFQFGDQLKSQGDFSRIVEHLAGQHFKIGQSNLRVKFIEHLAARHGRALPAWDAVGPGIIQYPPTWGGVFSGDWRMLSSGMLPIVVGGIFEANGWWILTNF